MSGILEITLYVCAFFGVLFAASFAWLVYQMWIAPEENDESKTWGDW